MFLKWTFMENISDIISMHNRASIWLKSDSLWARICLVSKSLSYPSSWTKIQNYSCYEWVLNNQVILLLISIKLSTKQWYGSLSPHSCGLLSFLTAWLFLICTIRLLLSKVFLILLPSLWAATSVPWIEGRKPGSIWSRSWPSVTVCKWDATGFKIASLGSPIKNKPSLERRLVSQLSRHTSVWLHSFLRPFMFPWWLRLIWKQPEEVILGWDHK